ncbi:MAG: ABC transporter ATP-binding protein [Lachnospiraceae bacterium]|nr:ABC transporter ATP-binding protein [Lachnospiraceae bacterium]
MYVELKDINKKFGNYEASRHISFGIEKGKLIGLLGPSGSGKTTILRMIAGLETPDSGEIIIDGKVVNDLPASERGIGFVFQNYALFRYKTVFDNIAFGLKIQKKSREEIAARVNELIRLVGLEGLEKRYPSQLSGGQRQRVAFARALAPNPQLLLLDEPFAAIDAKVRKELRSWLRETIDKLGITSIFVTHDQDEAIEVADEIIITNQGKVEQVGSPYDIYRKPETAFVASFFGNTDKVRNYGQFKGFSEHPDHREAVIRPEFIRVTRKNEEQKYCKSTVEGIVENTFFRGDYFEVKIRIGDTHVVAKRDAEESRLEIGEPVDVFLYKMFLTKDNEVELVDNPSLLENDIII